MGKIVCPACGHSHDQGTPCPECNCGHVICPECGHEHDSETPCSAPNCNYGH